MELCFSFIQWVLTKIQYRPFIWLAESNRHVFFVYLKFGLVIFDVDIKARTNYRTYKEMEILGTHAIDNIVY